MAQLSTVARVRRVRRNDLTGDYEVRLEITDASVGGEIRITGLSGAQIASVLEALTESSAVDVDFTLPDPS